VEYVRGEKANLGCHFPGVSVEEEGLFSLFSLKFTASLQGVVVIETAYIYVVLLSIKCTFMQMGIISCLNAMDLSFSQF
jgi:hypothetical protein